MLGSFKKWPQEKLKTMLIQNFGGDNQKALWYVMVFSGVVNKSIVKYW